MKETRLSIITASKSEKLIWQHNPTRRRQGKLRFSGLEVHAAQKVGEAPVRALDHAPPHEATILMLVNTNSAYIISVYIIKGNFSRSRAKSYVAGPCLMVTPLEK
jgi:hypothetical protein